MSDVQRVLVVNAAGEILLETGGASNALRVAVIGEGGLARTSNASTEPLASSMVGLLTNPRPYLYNGATYDRVRNNIEGELLASAARTAETNSVTQTNYNHKGVIIYVDWTVEAATSTLTPKVEIQDPSSGDWIELFSAAAALTAIGKATYMIYLGAISAGDGITEIQDLALPRTWRFTMAVGDADSATYSVGFSMLP